MATAKDQRFLLLIIATKDLNILLEERQKTFSFFRFLSCALKKERKNKMKCVKLATRPFKEEIFSAKTCTLNVQPRLLE